MNRLQIKAIGNSKQDISQKRGKYFEQLSKILLETLGYEIVGKPNVNYAGMEIDINGKSIATETPLYAECKCYEEAIDSTQLQKFYGKYMALYRKKNKSQALFLALPCLNSHAKGFYEENCEGQEDISMVLYEEGSIIDLLIQKGFINHWKNYQSAIDPELGSFGDYYYIYSEAVFIFVQLLLGKGSVLPSSIIILSANGEIITDEKSIELIKELDPSILNYNIVNEIAKTQSIVQSNSIVDHIVEVRGSSECFEYQFPADPKFFVGRNPEINNFKSFISEILENKTTSRGILLEANSGWGKSSLVLNLANQLKKLHYYTIAIDSRSASSPQFILQCFYHILIKYPELTNTPNGTALIISGFYGLREILIQVDENLKKQNKLLVIFLDQFENIFIERERLKHISDLLLFLCDRKLNIVLGFSWKSDFVGMMNEFPYDLRDNIIHSSKRFLLQTFTQVETSALLKKLSNEINAPVREDLKFLLSEFSQGYPWLLKKLCAHVKNQKEKGIAQSKIADNLLNVDQLFKEDIYGLSPAEISALKSISKQAPVDFSLISEEIDYTILQSLLGRRLIVHIAHKVDIYWDIFKDYLNYGQLPVQENYILRVFVSQIEKALKSLVIAKKQLTKDKFQSSLTIGESSYYNLMRDMKLLGLVKYDEKKIELDLKNITEDNFDSFVKNYFNDKLKKNRLVKLILENITQNDSLTIVELSKVLLSACPYITATSKTWQTYAKIFSDWLDYADLAIYNKRNNTLLKYQPSSELREKRGIRGRRQNNYIIPYTQFEPVNKVLLRILEALQNQTKISTTGIKFSTYKKAISTLEDLDLIKRIPGKIKILFRNYSEMENENFRRKVLAEKFLSLDTSSIFISILEQHSSTGATIKFIAKEFMDKLEVGWTEGTAMVHCKIILDWTRKSGKAPHIFLSTRQ